MSEADNIPRSFIEEAEKIILDHVSEESFGVSELAEAMHMSRSNLLRKIKKSTDLSASQFIRKIRLQRGFELLKASELSVSEVSYQCGFGSVSYFIKCFREEYGHPPGEIEQVIARRREEEKEQEQEVEQEQEENLEQEQEVEGIDDHQQTSKKKWVYAVIATIAMIAILSIFFNQSITNRDDLEKSIAVLPFKNESNDSSNVYFVNGLMESTLGSLQKIKDLKVISRTTSEKYRNSQKSTPEIAEELGVSYLIEGSGQKVGDQVLLNIKLIDAANDQPIWSEQYKRELTDIFDLQNEVAKEIAIATKAMVTPQELEIIQKKPTENLQAYDYYLRALDPYYSRETEGLKEAIELFKKAIEEDEQFALAYAHTAIAYYFLDLHQQEKQYTELINQYSDKALLYDSRSDVCLMAKALYYIETREYRLALPHLNKALEYNPNSASATHMLATFYAFYVPNTSKYLQYALRGIQIDGLGEDSTSASYSYLQLSNALVQSGFLEEAYKYVKLSLAHDPNNYFAPHLKIFIEFAMDRDYLQTQTKLLELWEKDTNRLDILQDIAKIYFGQNKFDSAYYYYQKLVFVRERQALDLYTHENVKIAYLYRRAGDRAKAEELFNAYAAYCEEDQSIYKSASIAVKHAYLNEVEEAIEQLKVFATQDNFQYWFLLIETDPLMDPLKSHPEFESVIKSIKDKFWQDHQILRESLEEKDLI